MRRWTSLPERTRRLDKGPVFFFFLSVISLLSMQALSFSCEKGGAQIMVGKKEVIKEQGKGSSSSSIIK